MPDPATREKLAEFCRRMYEKPPVAAALTGSHNRNWATPRSDIDLIVVIDREVGETGPEAEYVSGLLEAALTEALVVTRAEARRIFSLMEKPNYWMIPGEDILTMEKFASATPFLGAPVWKEISDGVSRADYGTKLASRQWRFAANSFDDICGAMKTRQFGVAIDCCRAMLRNEIEALLCLAGDTNGRSKWLTRRLQEADTLLRDLREDYLRFHFMFDLTDTDGLEKWLMDALRFHERLQVAFFERAEESVFTMSEVEAGIVPASPLFVWNINGNWYVKSADSAVSVSEQACRMLLAALKAGPDATKGEEAAAPDRGDCRLQPMIDAGIVRVRQSRHMSEA